MKVFRLLAIATFAVISMSASAQAVGRKFSTIYVQYNPTQFHVSVSGVSSNTSYTGLSAGYSYTAPIADALMIEGGLKAQWFFRSDKDDLHEIKTNMVSATIPINLVYSFVLKENVFSIDPYAGLFVRGNIFGKVKREGKNNSHDYNIFDDDDMGGNAYKRFQFGFQAGVKCRINDVFTVGGGYWMDLTKITDNTNLQGFEVIAGMTF